MAGYEEYTEYDAYYDEPRGPNRTWLMVAIVVIVVILCCCCLAVVAGFALFSQDILQELEGIAGLVPVVAGMMALV